MKICEHCGLDINYEDEIKKSFDNEERSFCCQGCLGVYTLLKEQNLDSFYQRKKGQTLAKVDNSNDDFLRYDTQEFIKTYIKQKDGNYEVSLILDGIHCSACIWLNERVLQKTDGILDLNINFTTHKAKILWDPSIIKLSQIIQIIKSIGYGVIIYDPKTNEDAIYKERKEYFGKLAVGIFSTMNIMWLAIARYLGYFSGMEDSTKELIYFAEIFLSTITLVISGSIFFRGAYFGLKNKIVNMDMLVSTGSLIAYFYSFWAVFIGNKEPYFDSVTMIITFVLIGKYLETISKKSAVDTMDALYSQIPSEVEIIVDGVKVKKNIYDIRSDDIIEIKTGEKVVFDVVVVYGEGEIDSSSITGESDILFVKKDDKILSGSVCVDGFMSVKVLKDYQSSTLYSIITLLEDALNKKPKIEQLANTLSRYFSSFVLSISILTFFVWFFIVGKDFGDSLMIAISVIIIACPCALALATPLATVIGLNFASKKKIIFKGAKEIETMAKADVLVVDKTGTLTLGQPIVIKSFIQKEINKEILYSLTYKSIHPISKSINKFITKKTSYQLIKDLKVKEIKGKGVIGEYQNKIFLGGNESLLKDFNIEFEKPQMNGSFYYFVENKKVMAIYVLRDKVKAGAKDVVRRIKDLKIEVIMATGDNEINAKNIANKVGIDTVKAGLLPEDKANLIDELHKDGKVVVFAGDGVNDVIALAKADIAIAMHSGADVAISTSDVVLLDNSLSALKYSFLISKRSYSFVKQNLLISFVYNLLTIPLATMGYIIPLIAALSMSFSSLLVVGNSIRIKKLKE